jgi:hypothetical protein
MAPECIQADGENYWNLRMKPFWNATGPKLPTLAEMQRKVSIFNEFEKSEAPPNEIIKREIVRRKLDQTIAAFERYILAMDSDQGIVVGHPFRMIPVSFRCYIVLSKRDR